LACFRGLAFGGPGFGPRFDAPGTRYPPSFTSLYLLHGSSIKFLSF